MYYVRSAKTALLPGGQKSSLRRYSLAIRDKHTAAASRDNLIAVKVYTDLAKRPRMLTPNRRPQRLRRVFNGVYAVFVRYLLYLLSILAACPYR